MSANRFRFAHAIAYWAVLSTMIAFGIVGAAWVLAFISAPAGV